MMQICRGWARVPLSLSRERRYHAEQLMSRLKPLPPESLASPLVRQPVWIRVEGRCVQLNSLAEIELACKLVCIQHNCGDHGPFAEEDWARQDHFLDPQQIDGVRQHELPYTNVFPKHCEESCAEGAHQSCQISNQPDVQSDERSVFCECKGDGERVHAKDHNS